MIEPDLERIYWIKSTNLSEVIHGSELSLRQTPE